jgi:hypothetical protein
MIHQSIEIHHADGRRSMLPLTLSSDFRGMCTVMPIVIGVAILLAVVARLRAINLHRGDTEAQS